MWVLSVIKFAKFAYGPARRTQLKNLDPKQNYGLRFALGVFWKNPWIGTTWTTLKYIYIDGSKMQGKVGCTVVIPTKVREIQLQSPFSIFNVEAEAINKAINMTKTSEQSKRGILSDSLSCLTPLNVMKKLAAPRLWKWWTKSTVRMNIWFWCEFRGFPGSNAMKRLINKNNANTCQYWSILV
jgi:hypothetical protein